MADLEHCIQAACTATIPPIDLNADGQLRAGALSSAIWDRPIKGPLSLNVVFLDGHPTVRDLVVQHARSWEEAANVRFNFLKSERLFDAHIRITMPASRVFQSYLGCQSVLLDRRLPSMTLGFTDDVLASPMEIRRLVLHEFGHALGLMHEHQNPNGGLTFRIPEVYQYFRRTQGWDERTVREQVITPSRIAELKNATRFDPDSIMLYAFPASILASGPVTATKLNYELSEGDRRYIASIYPGNPADHRPPVPIESGGVLPLTVGEPASGTIPIRGAEIPYGFEIKEAGRYIMETTTPPHAREEYWVLSLCDPEHRPIAVDTRGSSPHGLNALIDRDLPAGRYTLKVRHRLRTGLGDYGVVVRRIF